MSTQNIRDNLADHLAIRDLLDRYTNGINRRDWHAVQQVFATDGVWDCGGPDAGPNAFLFQGDQNCAQGIAGLVTPMEMTLQSNHACVIEVDGDRATATSTVNEMVLPPGAGNTMNIWGTYYDEIVRCPDGEWRFKIRRFRFSWIDSNGPKGQVFVRK